MLPVDPTAQAIADRLFAGQGGKRFRVKLGDVPCVELPADNAQIAIARYYQMMGIRGSSYEPVVEEVTPAPVAEATPKQTRATPKPASGLKEMPGGQSG